VAKVDDVTDLALVQIHTPPKVLVSLPLGDVSTLAVGQDVYAIGHPEGESWTFTKGIISQIRANYAWSTTTGSSHRAKVIQRQTPVNPGNSGGPLLDKNGRLIGINAFRRQGEGLNYAVSVDVIQAFLQNPTPSPPAGVAGEPRCPEAYVTKGPLKTDILGCYVTSTAPPPDLWLISRDARRSVAYAAGAGLGLGQINTVIESQDPPVAEYAILHRFPLQRDCGPDRVPTPRQRGHRQLPPA
jgi:S1-C subfamily serine protease